MSNLQMIEALCGLVAQQAMVARAQREYSNIIGADETPDFLK